MTNAMERPSQPRIVIADDDHVIRVVRYALEGEGAVTAGWIRAFFAPEQVEPDMVIALARNLGLHRTCSVLAGETGRADELAGMVDGASVIILRRGEVGSEIIRRADGLRLIQRLGARSHGIDVAAARRRGVAVSCLPRRTLAYTAEHALLLMLAVSKKLLQVDARTRAAQFDASSVHPIDDVAYNWLGASDLGGLWGKTLGVVGLGEVGALVAERARAFGMRVLYTKPVPLPATDEAAMGVAYRNFTDLLGESDFVSVHARATPQTLKLLDAAAFSRMKPNAIVVNTSRGSLIDEDALAEALESGRIAGAGLDTHFVEPRAAHDRIARLPNVVLTPHIAGGSRVGLLDEIGTLLINCAAALSGRGEFAWRVDDRPLS